MTKAKKKMTKSTFVIIIMAVAMVAMLAFGGTFAYFTATAKQDSADITTGYVKLNSNGGLAKIELTNVMPRDELVAADGITLTVDTSEAKGNYVAIKFTITAVAEDGSPIDVSSLGLNADSILASNGEGWYKADADNNIYIYGTDESTAVAKTGEVIVNSSAFVFDATDNWTQGQTHSDDKLMKATITITMEARSIQSSHVSGTEAVTQLVDLLTPDGP